MECSRWTTRKTTERVSRIRRPSSGARESRQRQPAPRRHSISRFDSDAAFLAFLGASNQKPIEAEVLDALISDLAGDDPILAGAAPLDLFVPGIGEGSQAQAVAHRIRTITGRAIHLHGIDASEALAEMARDRLSADTEIESAEVQTGDAFVAGDLPVAEMDLILVSHLLYYAPSPEAASGLVPRLVDALGQHGVAIFLHEAPNSDSAKLRSIYQPGVIARPSLLVDEVADRIEIPVYRAEYSSSFRVPRIEKGDLLAHFEAAAEDPEDSDLLTAERLMQFVFRLDLAEMREPGTLDAAVEGYLAVLDPETNEFEIRVEVQILPSRALAADSSARARLEACVEGVQIQAEEIARRAAHWGT